MSTEEQTPSLKPYLVRAIHEWCTENGYTPYLAVAVDAYTKVPREYVKDGQIVLNLDLEATHGLQMANDAISFSARFNGAVRELWVPVNNIAAIYARENGQGMAFEPIVREAEPELVLDLLETSPSARRGSIDSAEDVEGVRGVKGVETSDSDESTAAHAEDGTERTEPATTGKPHLKRVK